MSEQCRICPGRIANDAGQLLGGAFDELVPPEAQTHLLAAQRELLLALTIIIEHRVRRRGAEDSRETRERPQRVEIE